MAKEKDLEKKCRLLAKQLGGELLKFTSPGNSGVQDRILLLPKWAFIAFIEFKKPGEGLKPKQQHWYDRMAQLGQWRYVVHTFAQFKIIAYLGPEEHRLRAKKNYA